MLKYQDEWAFVSPYDGLGGQRHVEGSYLGYLYTFCHLLQKRILCF
jgi:hypothetical protein